MPPVKVLSQAGTSLADVYRVQGSIAGISALDIDEVKAVHSLGPQIHSERLLVVNQSIGTLAIAQNTNFDVELSPALPDCVHRVLSIAVVSDTAAAVAYCAIHVRDPRPLGVDHPVWVWNSATDQESLLRIELPAPVTAQYILRPVQTLAGGAPTILTRTGTDGSMSQVWFRGRTAGFGAGTADVYALLQLARPAPQGVTPGTPSSHGLPIPSW